MREGVSQPYLIRILRLAYLGPDIVEAILDGRQSQPLTLESIARAIVPIAWAEQRRKLDFRRL